MDDTLASDLVAMWHSELTAMAADREVREFWTTLLALWAQSAGTAASLMSHDAARGSTGPAQPARPAPAAAASQPGLAEVEQLNRRVAELEQRLAELLARDGGRPPLHDALAQVLAADRALIAGIAAYRAASLYAADGRSAAAVGRGRNKAAGLWRRGAGGAVRAQPDQPRLYSRSDGRGFDAALAERARGASLSAGLGLAGRGGADIFAHRLYCRAAGAGDRGIAGQDRAGRLLHGRAAGAGGGVAPAGESQRPGAAGHTVGFPCRRSGGGQAARATCCRRWSR